MTAGGWGPGVTEENLVAGILIHAELSWTPSSATSRMILGKSLALSGLLFPHLQNLRRLYVECFMAPGPGGCSVKDGFCYCCLIVKTAIAAPSSGPKGAADRGEPLQASSCLPRHPVQPCLVPTARGCLRSAACLVPAPRGSPASLPAACSVLAADVWPLPCEVVTVTGPQHSFPSPSTA